MSRELSHEASEKIDKMVERVARKAGYTGRENMTYKELLQAKFEQKKNKLEHKFNKYRHKFSMKSTNKDFSEEIKTYLQDGLADLMNEGYSEEEALKLTMEKFDEAELNESFDDFVEAFGGFGMKNYNEIANWYSKEGEAIGLFYAAFTVLGIGIGALTGYILGHTLVNTLIGTGIGFFIGVGLGLLSNAVIAVKRK